MRRLQKAACAAVLLLTSAAGAVELSLVPNLEGTGDEIEVPLSETAAISVYLQIGANDGNVSMIDIFFDATPINDPATVGYDVLGRVFRMTRNDGSDWFRPQDTGDDFNIEEYALIAADSDNDRIGTNGPWSGHVDSIIIHGTEIGSYDLYFENEFTAEGAPRPPRLRDSNGIELSDVFFRNAWRDDRENFDVPFRVIVVPEPSTMVLMAVAALGIIRRRRRDGEDTTCGRKHWSRSRVCAR